MSDHKQDSKSPDRHTHTDQVVRDSLKFRAQLIDSIPNPVFYKDTEGVYRDCNQAFAEKVLGLPRREVLGKTVYELPEVIPSELADVYHDADMKLIKNPGTQTYEAQVKYADGMLHDVVFNKATLGDSDGEVTGMIGVMLDVTEQRKAQAQEQYAVKIKTASEIAEHAATILEPQVLLEAVIPLIKERFDLYHVHVYTVDAKNRVLYLAAGYGEPGRKMLEEGHNISLDAQKSLVARAVRTQAPILVDDVSEDPNFMPNPLLPDTRSEVAVPAIAGGEVLGVFDVQHDEVGLFSESDVAIFTTLAGQIATALHNARQFEALRSHAEFEALITQISTEFLNLPRTEIDERIREALERIGKYIGVDRAYVFQFSEDGKRFSNTHEWRAKELEAQKQNLQNLRVEDLSWWAKTLQNDENIVISSLDELPPEAKTEKKMFAAQDIKSTIAVPITYRGEVFGFIGFEAVQEPHTWLDMEINFLNFLSDIFSSAMARLRAVAHLIESERRLSTLMSNLPGMAYRMLNKPDWPAQMVSEGAETLTGYAPEDLMMETQKLTYGALIVSEDQDRVWEMVQKGVEAHEPYQIIYRIKTADEQIKWVWEQGQGVYDEAGDLLALEGFITDITERKRAERALQENEQRLSAATRIAKMGYWEFDVETQMFTFNDLYYKTFHNTTAEEVGGYQMSAREFAQRFVPPEDAPAVAENIQKALEATDPNFQLQTESRNLTIDGEERWVSVWLTVEKDEAGRTVKLHGVNQDITERKQAELERQRFTTSLETAAEISEQVGSILDPDQLLETVIPLIKERFGLYYVHVYTVDKDAGNLNLTAGYGETGEKMLAESHSIPLAAEQSLVARAARTKKPVLVEDVTEDPNFLPNPLLPETKTEVAVPAIAGGEVLGVFDVQHDEAHTFTDADIDVFLTLAGQIANALQSAALFKDVAEERDSAERYLELAGSALVALDTQGNVTLINQAGCEILGYAEDEILGRNWFDLVVPEELRGEGKARFPQLISGEAEPRTEYTAAVITKSGTKRMLHWHDSVLQDDAGNITGTLSSGEDITERLAMQAERERFANKLSTASEIAAQINQILDPDQLLRETVTLLTERFGLYHAHVYTVDENEMTLNLRFGYGRPGKIMLRQGHQIPLNREHSLVAQAARTKHSVLVNDVASDPGFMPNALLPDTKAELAVPLITGGETLGVFDVQIDEAGYFTDADVDVFETLANQIATALENAELFERQEQAETAMRESAEKIRAVFDAITDGIGVSNMMGEITDVNEGLLNLYGYDTREDVIGRNTMELIAREDWPKTTESINQTLSEGRSPHQEVNLVKANGGKFIGEVRASLLYDEEGEPSGIISVIRDITERKEAERALEMTRSSVEASGDAFYWFDADASFIDVNQGTLDLLGYSREEILDLQVFDVDPTFPRAAWPKLKGQVKAEGAIAFEGVNQTKDGEQIAVNVVVSYVPFQDQEIYFSIARDITEQKAARDAILQERNFSDTVINGLPGIFYLYDSQGNLVRWNDNFQKILGYTEEDLRQRPATDFIAVEDRPTVAARMEQVYLEGQSETEAQLLTKDGTKIPYYFTGIRAMVDGEPYLAGVGIDMTAQKKAQAAIQQSQERLSRAQQTAHLGSWEWDFTTNKTTWSDENYRLSGYEPGDIEPTFEAFMDMVHPEDQPIIEESLEAIQNGERDQDAYQYRLILPNGNVRWIEGQLEVIFDDEGAPERITGTNLDITERKEAEEERERFNVQLSTAADIATQASAILDPDELLTETVNLLCERFNLYHTHVYTLDQEQLRIRAGYGKAGQVMLEEKHTIPLDREQSLVARAARSREIVVANDVTQEPGFMANPLLPETKAEIAVPLVIGDEVLGVFDAQAREIGRFTERDIDVFRTLAGQLATAVQNAVYVEELQLTTNRLREVDRLKSEFLANMSHELRTPLNSIIGYAEIMLMGIDGDMDPETLEDIKAIYENGQHLLDMINDILDLAKIEAGRLTLRFEDSVDLAQVLNEAKSGNASLFANKPVELRLVIEDELPEIRADRLRLHQIFNNLISNAQKFTPEGYVEVQAYPQGSHWVCVTVADTGIGIAEDDIMGIFERFEQVDGSSTRSADGTGLGLAITRELVQMHGGRIEVESEVDVGSKFTVWLPIKE